MNVFFMIVFFMIFCVLFGMGFIMVSLGEPFIGGMSILSSLVSLVVSISFQE